MGEGINSYADSCMVLMLITYRIERITTSMDGMDILPYSILSTIYIFLVLLFEFLVSGWCGKGVFRLSIIYFLFCTPTNKY